jgi:protoheme IX farnesyltransferase
VADFVALTKPKIMLLLLVTALGSMFLAARGAPALSTAVLVLVGGSLGAGGANALNHYLDRDIDERMGRTRRRPLPGNRIEPRQALLFGIVLNLLAFGILASWVNLLSALLTMGATLFYVFVYTQWLKRSTTQNIVIGGAAGAVPPMVGWAAVTGDIGLPAIYLFAIVFFWTPPHFWALALLIRDDYAAAGVPMLPVVRGVEETARSILLHALILFAITSLFFTLDEVGWIYFIGALALGTGFLGLAWRLLRRATREAARTLYLYSLLYLAVLFLIIAIDGSVG